MPENTFVARSELTGELESKLPNVKPGVAKASAIASPGETSAALKVAVDEIRVVLKAAGLIA